MNVSIKDLNMPLSVGNVGTEFQVKSTKNKHLGRFYVNKSGVSWFKGKELNGKSIKWEALIKFITEQGE